MNFKNIEESYNRNSTCFRKTILHHQQKLDVIVDEQEDELDPEQ